MSTFTALNIEPDDQIDDEVDNTKELQIEEGLKLYQTALKFHSQGPASFSQAAEAYTNLFNSEIFKYPESTTEFDRIYQSPELELLDQSFVLDLDLAGTGADGAPSTLPQILYLSYKNHGQFILDCVKSQTPRSDLSSSESLDISSIDHQARAALNYFTLALASDPSDTELWRRASRVAAALGSRRVARYCLEAAVEVDDDPTVAEIDPTSLEEGFAGEQLKEQLEVLSDDTALSHPVMAPFLKKTMAGFLRKYMDPYTFLPDLTKRLGGDIPTVLDHTAREDAKVDGRFIVDIPQRGWTAVGDALCAAFLSSQGLSGTGIILNFPDESQPEPEPEPEPMTADDQLMQDIMTAESPNAESNEPVVITPVTVKPDDQVSTIVTTTTTVPLSDDSRRQSSAALPTRKRSQSAAGISETPEEDNGTQKRSKRIRNRENTEGFVDPATQYAEQLKTYVKTDEDALSFLGELLRKIGVDDLKPFSELQTALANENKSDRNEVLVNTAVRDLRDILKTWDDDKASTFVNANAADILGSSAASANVGLAAFLEHSKSGPSKLSTIPPFSESEGVLAFATSVQKKWSSLQAVIYDWLLSVLRTYRGTLWPEDLKVSVVRILTSADGDIFNRFQEEIEFARNGFGHDRQLADLEVLAQTFFELHLDIYSHITGPSSIVQYETRVITKERLDRWADLVANILRTGDYDASDEISVRYIWASVFYATMADNVSREHKVLCWTDLQTLLKEADSHPVELQNSAVMPEISIDAAEREVSRLTTMDFFFNLFQTDTSDPVAIIETLEPVLDPESACQRPQTDGDVTASVESMDSTPAALRDMWKFLKAGSTSLRLFLWQRLRDAYSSIGYNTKVFSCHLKCIEIIVGDLRTDDYVDSADEPRRHRLLTWLKALDDLLVKSLTIALNDAATCFEIIDDRHIKSTCAALAQLTTVLHTAAIFDDEVRVGMTQLPQSPAYSPHGSFTSFVNKLREMQVRTWSLQYCMVKEAMAQNSELFPDPKNNLAEFLALVHDCLGLRKFCKASNKIFLKMMKMEMLRLKDVDRWEDYLGQVLYDLYGIRLGLEAYLLEDHGCPTESLDRRTVLSIADHVIGLAIHMPMKDLLKHELRSTIEKMQAAIGQAKSSPQMLHNLRNYSEYLKGSIRPLDMYKALKGQLQVDSLPVITPESPLANKGWYFLLGMIALTKFRSQRRLGPGAQQDDMRVGASFIRLQLQFTPDDWETWYRLAQCFDYELEEEVMWSADKINNHRAELVKLQRGAIHCYVMALSTAARTADDSSSTAETLSEMYYDFGMRLYASSREPFSMEAFWVDEFEKHMSGSAGMYKKPLHDEMSRYRVWKYAATLFRRSLADRPSHWMTHYMLGKCLWKMFCKAADEWDPQVKATQPSIESVINSLIKTIETVPKPKDGRQEPILEPHHKLVSVIHKLVLLGAMQPQAAADLLQQQPYAIDKGEHIDVHDQEEWESFILKSMRHLRSADKQHWHHRMIARVANILYDEEHPDYLPASAARHEFRESIFTKTMHIQVWKPDAERPGRHCVYMERYVRYICKILLVLNDKANMEQLAKRVRKKSPDFHRFSVVWSEVCTTYLRLIRRAANVPANMDEVFKSIPHEEFEEFSDRLNTWVTDPTISHPTLDALRETIELKKLNTNQMKPAPIDDLINDAWAVLYTQVAKTLPGPDPALKAQTDGETAPGPRPLGPMSLNHLVMDMNGTQIPVPVTFAGSEPSRPRKIGISRREVMRRAEMAVNRMSDAPRTLAPSRPALSEPGTAQGSNANSAQISAPSPRAEDAIAQETTEKNDDSSAPGSVHDSADDESDLSDVPDMEDEDGATMFPHLMKNDEPGNNSGSEGTIIPAP